MSQTDSSIEHFRWDLVQYAQSDPSQKQLENLFEKYSGFLSPQFYHSDKLPKSIDSLYNSFYPLHRFSGETWYTNYVDTTVHSSNEYRRVLAYQCIIAAGDTSREPVLLNALNVETKKEWIFCVAVGLLEMHSRHTSPLFDFLVKYEDFGDAHLIPMYMALEADSLKATALARINDEDPKAKVLAVQSFMRSPLTAKLDSVIRSCIEQWPVGLKGYAIVTANKMHMQRLAPLVAPLIDSIDLNGVIFTALAQSPSPADRWFLHGYAGQKDSVSQTALNAFLESPFLSEVKFGLQLLHTKKRNNDFYPPVHTQPLLKSDSLLTDLQQTLSKLEDGQTKAWLANALADRKDKASTDILLAMLHSKNEAVSNSAAMLLKDNRSPRVMQKEVQEMIRQHSRQ